MGYSTDFSGSFDLDRQLEPEHKAYLEMFSATRRMKRDAEHPLLLDDPVRERVGLPVGEEGCYFVGGGGHAGQDHDDSVLGYNNSPADQPGLWCQWVPDDTGTEIVWDQGEKFYDYVGWLEYIIEHFLSTWGYILNGEIEWSGEDFDDRGIIVVRNNRVGIRNFAPSKVAWRDE